MINNLEIAKKTIDLINISTPYEYEYKLSEEDCTFLEEYKIKEFFLLLLKNFDPQKHTSNSSMILDSVLKEYNSEECTNLSIEELIEKQIVLSFNQKFVLNPFLNTRDITSCPYSKFIIKFSKRTYFYPLFDDPNFLNSLINTHNQTHETTLCLENLLTGDVYLSEMLFRNSKSFRAIFEESCLEYLHSISNTLWKTSIHIFSKLLVEIQNAEIKMYSVFHSLTSLKKEILLGYLSQYTKPEDANRFLDPNYKNRLQYVPYELDGVDIYNPPKKENGISLVPYTPNRSFEKNMFKKIESELRTSYGLSIQFKERIFRELNFIAENCRYKTRLTPHTCLESELFQTMLLPAFGSISDSNLLSINYIKPLVIRIIYLLVSRETHYNFANQHQEQISSIQFVKNLTVNYLESIQPNTLTVDVLLDLYCYVVREKSRCNSVEDKEIFKIIVDKVMDLLDSRITEDELNSLIIPRLKKECSYDFTPFEFLSRKRELKSAWQMVEVYLSSINEPKFYGDYLTKEGIEYIESACSILSQSQLEILRLSFFNIEDQSDHFYEERKAIFHLTFLSRSMLLCNKSEMNFVKYIAESFTTFRLSKDITWEDILYCASNFQHKYYFDVERTLTYCIFKLADKTNYDTKELYKALEESLKFSEKVMISEFLDLDSSKILCQESDFVNSNLGTAGAEARYLFATGYYKESLNFINTIYEIENIHKKNLVDDYIIELHIAACIEIKDFDTPNNLLSKLKDDHTKEMCKAHLAFANGDYSRALSIYDEGFKYRTMSANDIQNISSCLIKLGRYDDAIAKIHAELLKTPEHIGLLLNYSVSLFEVGKKAESIFYAAKVKELDPKNCGAKKLFVNSITEMIPEAVSSIVNSTVAEFDTEEIIKFSANSQQVVMLQLDHNVFTEIEIKLIQEIQHAIVSLESQPIFLSDLSEDECSNFIKASIDSFARYNEIVVERERPEGYAVKKTGEIDFFIYNSDRSRQLLAVGENKYWGKFEKQLKQLIGYLRVDNGFGFTIIFNTERNLQTIIDSRYDILKNFYVDYEGKKCFQIENNQIYNATLKIPNSGKDTLLTIHQNPEKKDSYVKIYHFIINAFTPERKQSGIEARPTEKNKIQNI